MLVHFWMVFVVPRLKSPAVCEECVGAIFRDSVHTSMMNRSSVGYLLGLPVDIDSILINGVSRVYMCIIKLYINAEINNCVFLQLFSDQIIHQMEQVGENTIYIKVIFITVCHVVCP